jgi:hypothetical protein
MRSSVIWLIAAHRRRGASLLPGNGRAGSFSGTGAELISGVRVFDYTEMNGIMRLEKSCGTTPANSPAYEANTTIPLKPWRSLLPADPILAAPDSHEFTPSSSIRSLLPADPILAAPDSHEFTPSSSIAIISVPPSLLDAARSIDPGPDRRTAEREVLEFADSLKGDESVETRLLGAYSREWGLVTTTLNPRTSQYIGLHLDSFYSHPLETRHLSPNRLCINTGSESRFLLFINLTLQQMHEVLLEQLDKGIAHTWDETNVGNTFMRHFPHYPVIKVLLQPGEAYIAPTENLIHDSTTEGMSAPDVTVTLLGAFVPSNRSYQRSSAISTCYSMKGLTKGCLGIVPRWVKRAI